MSKGRVVKVRTKRSRPVNRKFRERLHINAPPEEVARAIMQGPPKADDEWRYPKEYAKQPKEGTTMRSIITIVVASALWIGTADAQTSGKFVYYN